MLCAMVSNAQIIVNTVAGGGSENGLPATQGYRWPEGQFAVGPDGTIYFADYYWIWSIGPDGIQRIIAGNGVSGFNGDGAALSTSLNNPTSLARDSQGNLYFFDNNRVRKLAGGAITTIAGNGLPPSSTTDGPALSTPVGSGGIAVDGGGNIYISEYGMCRVRKITADGNIALLAGAAQPNTCAAGNTGDGGPATAAYLSDPMDLAVDASGNVYIEEETAIRKVSPGGTITTVSANVPMMYTDGLAIDQNGALYFYSGSYTGTGTANGLYRLDPDGTATMLSQTTLSHLTVDANQNIYVASAHLYRLSNGSMQLVGDGATYLSPDGSAAAGSVIYPTALAADPSGRIYFADEHCRVRTVNSQGNLATVAGTGTCGTVVSGPATAANMPQIKQIAYGGGTLAMLLGSEEVAWIDANGNLQSTSGLFGGSGLAVDGNGVIYAGSSYFGVATFKPGGAITSLVHLPAFTAEGLAIAPDGNVYIAGKSDVGFGQGYIFTPAGQANGTFNILPDTTLRFCVTSAGIYQASASIYFVNSTGGAGIGGVPGYGGDGGPAYTAEFYSVEDVAADANGNVFALDTGNGRIRKLSGSLPASPPVLTSAGVVSSASYSNSIAPGEILSIFGQNFGTATVVAQVENNRLPFAIGNVSVAIGRAGAPLLSVSPTQINAVASATLEMCNGTTTAQVTVDGLLSAEVTVPCAAAAPALFTADQSGKGQGSILNQDASVNSQANPAPRGSVISIYGTGGGPIAAGIDDGYLDLSPPFGTISNVSVTIGGQNATVNYAGGAPDLVFGAMQINAVVPESINPGAADVVVTIGGVASNTVQVWTR